MRISTAGMHRSSIDAILEHQVKLSKTQNQVATGKKFQTAAEDPIGAARVAGLERTLADNAQYERNSNIIESRLELRRADAGGRRPRCCRARATRRWPGANATLGPAERKMLANRGAAAVSRRSWTWPTARMATASTCSPATSTATQPFAQGARPASTTRATRRRGRSASAARNRWPTGIPARTPSWASPSATACSARRLRRPTPAMRPSAWAR